VCVCVGVFLPEFCRYVSADNDLICPLCTGVLVDVQNYYSINDKEASLLSTAFIVSYMLLSPLFGYLGDRHNRTVIMSCGIISWSAITLASSFVTQQVRCAS